HAAFGIRLSCLQRGHRRAEPQVNAECVNVDFGGVRRDHGFALVPHERRFTLASCQALLPRGTHLHRDARGKCSFEVALSRAAHHRSAICLTCRRNNTKQNYAAYHANNDAAPIECVFYISPIVATALLFSTADREDVVIPGSGLSAASERRRGVCFWRLRPRPHFHPAHAAIVTGRSPGVP